MKIWATELVEAAYDKGRKDQREEILDIINSADDMSQAMYRIIKYLMCEKLQEMEELEELKNE